ncbi:hypothetical protein [Caldimonas brevitalea]|uniref:Type II secretion system protein GspC N-terminal domain-containing protein n=1 Tax=Caldimonas brevitalea TaxID=413882 RepID=A0A0G3BT78_9BURK|nr:hypothetical protein [Caldimonas brevitalea]AKJ29730.1 hypothetical protein AAW51_3039 [Caldimonas brevitalea]
MKRWPKLTLALCCVNLAAALGAGGFVLSSLSTVPTAAGRETPPAADAAPTPRLAAQPLSTDAWSASPLFTASRKPPAPVAAPTEPVSLPPSPRLVGIVTDGARGRRALLESPDATTRQLLAVGQESGGWRVIAIDRRSIRLTPSDAGSAETGAETTLRLPSLDTPATVPHD